MTGSVAARCLSHYDGPALTRHLPPLRRFWARVKKTRGCWLWTGSGAGDMGYGILSVDGRNEYAHRFSFERFVRPLKKGEQALHRCDSPRCVRPDHLFAGTQLDNMRDAAAKGRVRGRYSGATHCIHGHEFTEENTGWYIVAGKKHRRCRTCNRTAAKGRRQKRKIAVWRAP